MKISLYYAGYYTHFSLVLFFISLMLPFNYELKFIILLNSVIVGLSGNLIFIKDYDKYITWYKNNYPDKELSVINDELQQGNFIWHTLPMIVSLLLLPLCVPFIKNYKDALKYGIIILSMIIGWSLIPYKGMIVTEKVNNSYESTKYALMCTLIVITIICFFITYFSKNENF